jgi:hypothetical protein
VLRYATEIRFAIELLLLIGSLVWAIRRIAYSIAERDTANCLSDELSTKIEVAECETKKLTLVASKLRDQIIPQQVRNIALLQREITAIGKEIQKEQLLAKVRLFQEVKEHWTKDPKAKYFCGSNYVHQDEN